MVVPKARLAIENLALRQQLAVCKQSITRPKLRPRDRIFWVWLSRLWSHWQSALLIVLCHERRRVVHLNVTANPYAQWTAQQIVNAFPDEEVPRFLLRDRDAIYGQYFQDRMQGLGIEGV